MAFNVKNEDEDYTIRIHAGENDSLKDNVENSIKCVRDSLKPGQIMPRVRIGHGLYTADLNSEKGKNLLQDIIQSNAVMEFQITSNVRLNNLSELSNHPLKKYLSYGVKCVQGTDGCGFYGVDTIDEQLALQNILGLTENELEQMRKVEDEIIEHSKKYFEEKSKKFSKAYWKKIVGVFIFVAIPLPLTGVWTGTCVALFIGLDFVSTCISVILGNIVAGLLITLILEFFPWLNNWLFYIFLGIIALTILYELVKYLILKKKAKNK